MRRSFRLIDAIVAVGVVGLALGLVIVPLRRARDEGETNQCRNNIRQLNLALIQYQTGHGVFPASEADGNGTSPGHSCWTMGLPYLDIQLLYNDYDFRGAPGSVENSSVVAMRLGSFLCPANPNCGPTPASKIRTADGRAMPGNSSFAPCHYGVNWGGDRLGIVGDFAATNGSCRGVMMAIPGQGSKGPNRCIGVKDITDGLAETVLIAERRGGQGWAAGGWAGSEFDVGDSPSYSGSDPRAEMASAGSHHDGGRVVVGFCDGSVRLVSPGLDRRLWYAMITRDGAEAVPKVDIATK